MENGKWRMGNGERGPENRSQGRLARETWTALAILALGLTILGADKSPATRALQRFLSRGQTSAVTSSDVVRGWREAGADAGGPVEMPAGAVTNDLLRRRGGFDWAFRVEPEGWRFPYRDGALDGVTVFACGEVRPDVGTLYFPIPITNGVSLLPEARWGQLPNGGASVFSHAVTTNGSLLLDWRNALVGRDPNAPTNLQMELFHDGSFAWRTDDTSQFYLPVLPFDYDDDGLENSVDPEPLVPNPVDAHGTPPEWYRVVCSNVFTVADDSNLPTFKPSNINSNAYYFIDVVAEEGPAPIWFNADRDSRLGSPVVVALAGETNHVPLLIGVEYAVTSTVPFSVTVPEGGFAEANQQNERNSIVKWPLEFEFVEETTGTYTVNVVPYDPGGTFSWNRVPSSRGAMLLSSASSSFCGCWSGSGPSVSFNCSEVCSCYGGCYATGTYTCQANFSVTGGVCRCGHYDEPHGEDTPPPPPDPLVGGLSISFSKPAVIFEDSYTNGPNDIVAKQSTVTRLTISASGGVNGGSFTLQTQNLSYLTPENGTGPLAITSGMTLQPGQTYYVSFVCSAARKSESENDIRIDGEFIDAETGVADNPSATTTAVRIELEPIIDLEYKNRHAIGVREECIFKWMPAVSGMRISSTGEGATAIHSGFARYEAPLEAESPVISAEYNNSRLGIPLSVLEPRSIYVVGTPTLNDFGLGHNCAGGVGMQLELHVAPTNVSFSGIAIQEVPSNYKDPQGYFANSYFSNVWSHTRERHAGEWHNIASGNFFMLDNADMGDLLPRMTPDGSIANNTSFGWILGTMNWKIPVGWNERNASLDDMVVKSFQTYWQQFAINSQGTLRINKLGQWVQRGTNNVVQINGVAQ